MINGLYSELDILEMIEWEILLVLQIDCCKYFCSILDVYISMYCIYRCLKWCLDQNGRLERYDFEKYNSLKQYIKIFNFYN